MKTFKQFISEQHYGSLIDVDKYNSLDSADKLLYKYTADAFTAVGSKIDTLLKRYPYSGGTLYRGLHFSDQEQHDEFLEKVKDGDLTVGDTSSWTPSLSTAQDFAHSKKSYFPTPELMFASAHMDKTGDHMSGYGGVVLMTKVGEGVGVDVSKSSFAKESEVILARGTYKVKVHELMEPFHRKYDTPEKVSSIIDELKKAKTKNSELDKKANYVRKSWAKKLHPEEADVLMKYMSGRFLTIPTSELAELGVRFEISKSWFSKGSDSSHRLDLDVSSNIDEELYDMCTSVMQGVIDKRMKVITKALASAIKQIVNHPNVDDIDDFRIYNIRRLMRFLPDETAKAVDPLRKLLGKKYHSLNSRESNKQVTTSDEMRKRGETIGNVVQAMSDL